MRSKGLEVNSTAHHRQVWCSEQIQESIPRFWICLPTPSLLTGPVYLGTRWQKWSAATWREQNIAITHGSIKLILSKNRNETLLLWEGQKYSNRRSVPRKSIPTTYKWFMLLLKGLNHRLSTSETCIITGELSYLSPLCFVTRWQRSWYFSSVV